MVAKKIKAMKDNKSSGVDGIPPNLLMETVEQISIPLARVFTLSLKQGVIPFESRRFLLNFHWGVQCPKRALQMVKNGTLRIINVYLHNP